MASDLQKAIDELEHFSAILKSANKLYASASELVKYCLPHQTLKELVETLWCTELQADRRQKICKLVHDIVQRISTNTASAIRKYAKEKSVIVNLTTNESWGLYDKCSGDKLGDVLSNCLFLFHTVYNIRSIPYLFSLDEIDEFDRIYYAAKQLLDQTELDSLKRKLPKAVLEMYGQRIRSNKEVNSIFAHRAFLFSTSEALNTERTDTKEDTKKFTETVEKLISKITTHDFDIFEMRRLVEFNLTGKIDFALFRKACNVLSKIQAVADFRVADEFLKVLKCIACSYKDWGAIMTFFYGEFQEVNGSLQTFKQFYQNFEEDMRNLLIYLEDHAQLHTNQIKLEKATDECAWLLIISPVETMISLFLQCLENILMVPNLIRILRKLPTYCDIELEAVFDEDSTTKRKTPILMLALRHILTVERSSIQCGAKRRNFVYICVALCRERHALLKDGKNETENEGIDGSEAFTAPSDCIVDFALVDGSVILNHLVLPTLKRVFYQEIAVEIGKKLLTSIGARRTPIIWKAEQGIKLGQGEVAVKNSSGVSILQLILILLEIINENKDFDDHALVGSCQDFLRLLGERLEEDGLIIERDAFNSLLTCFDKSLWAYRYAVASWFYKCLASYKREIPLLLYEALNEENRQTFKAVKTGIDDDDISGRGFLRKLFELAAIHSELALNIMKRGFSTSVNIAGHDVSGAFVDVIRDHNNFPNNKINGLVEVIRVIVNQIDLSRQIIPLLTEISESSFYGLRLIEPLLLIQEAVICAVHYDKKNMGDLTAVPFSVLELENQVAVKLLKLFCELAKDHMQKEMIDLRRSYIKHKVEIKEPRLIPSDINISREIRVETELIQLYFAAVILANHVIGLPSYLKILLVQLTNFHIEMGRMKLGLAFDEIISKALLDQGAKEKTANNKQFFEKFCVVSDSDHELASVEMNDCSTPRTSTISNIGCETKKMIDVSNGTVEAIRDSFNDRLSKTSEQNAIFMAGTQMIKDRAMSAIIENHLHHNKRNNGRKSVVGPKPRHGALPPLSLAGGIINIGSEAVDDGQGDGQDYASCRWNGNGGSSRSDAFRRKNKKRK
ncbi:hypothetical protein LOAG_16589 [Loa loa]|uniref:Edg1 TPR repeats region domain-containing protein n=1 Tax=Loa loa TaxID=7209 RepID=A0A1S0UL77_LOALO|nr:hypothetical protein LOAG_16589 [Loa loa]EJD76460.1 hypothetical protein LOAG_16589 [Loa loa]